MRTRCVASPKVRRITYGVAVATLLTFVGSPAATATAPVPNAAAMTQGVAVAERVSMSTRTRVRAAVVANATVDPTGKIRLAVASNAREVTVKYRTSTNKARKVVLRVPRTRPATTTLKSGANRIRVQAMATSKLRRSAWVSVRALPSQTEGAQPGATDPVSSRPRAACGNEALAERSDDGRIDLLLDCVLGTYTPDPLLGVRVYAFTDPTFTQLATAAVNPTQREPGTGTVRFEGLANNTRYYFQTSALDRVGEGERLYVAGLEQGINLYRHHRVADVVLDWRSGENSFQATWTNDPADPRPVTSVVVDLYSGIQYCTDQGCMATPFRQTVQTPSNAPDWATRYTSGVLTTGTWCIRITPVDQDGTGFASDVKCLELGPATQG